MDEVSLAVENLKKEWDQTVSQLKERIQEIEKCGKSGKGTEEANALPRLNGAAQDCLASLRSMQFRLDLLAQQLPTMEEVQSGQALVEIWKDQYQKWCSMKVKRTKDKMTKEGKKLYRVEMGIQGLKGRGLPLKLISNVISSFQITLAKNISLFSTCTVIKSMVWGKTLVANSN